MEQNQNKLCVLGKINSLLYMLCQRCAAQGNQRSKKTQVYFKLTLSIFILKSGYLNIIQHMVNVIHYQNKQN